MTRSTCVNLAKSVVSAHHLNPHAERLRRDGGRQHHRPTQRDRDRDRVRHR